MLSRPWATPSAARAVWAYLVDPLQHKQIGRAIVVGRVDAVGGGDVQDHAGLGPGEHAEVDDGAGKAGRAGDRAGQAGDVGELLGGDLGDLFAVEVRLAATDIVDPGGGLWSYPANGFHGEMLRRVLRVGAHLFPQSTGDTRVGVKAGLGHASESTRNCPFRISGASARLGPYQVRCRPETKA